MSSFKENNIFIWHFLVEMVLSFYFVAQSGLRSGLLCAAFVVLVQHDAEIRNTKKTTLAELLA